MTFRGLAHLCRPFSTSCIGLGRHQQLATSPGWRGRKCLKFFSDNISSEASMTCWKRRFMRTLQCCRARSCGSVPGGDPGRAAGLNVGWVIVTSIMPATPHSHSREAEARKLETSFPEQRRYSPFICSLIDPFKSWPHSELPAFTNAFVIIIIIIVVILTAVCSDPDSPLPTRKYTSPSRLHRSHSTTTQPPFIHPSTHNWIELHSRIHRLISRSV